MADETTQAGEETSWWVFDAFADSELPSTSFDEPLEWPDTLEWGDVGDADAELQFPVSSGGGSYDLSEAIFPEGQDFAVDPPPAPAAVAPLAALGGGAPEGRQATGHSTHAPLPDSIWSADRPAADAVLRPAAGALGGDTTVLADLDGDRGGGWRRRFDLRHGNAAVIALISVVSLVLLGMFMSVRARNDVPADSSQTRTTSDRIAVQRPLNTVPLTIPNTTLGPPSTINIADLVPTAEDATNAGAATSPATGSGSGSSGGGGGGGGTTGTTAAPRSTGSGTATTQPAAQQTNTTAAPAPVETTPPPTEAPPVNTTTVTTRPRTTPTSITFPTFPTVPGDGTGRTYTVPTFPPGFGDD